MTDAEQLLRELLEAERTTNAVISAQLADVTRQLRALMERAESIRQHKREGTRERVRRFRAARRPTTNPLPELQVPAAAPTITNLIESDPGNALRNALPSVTPLESAAEVVAGEALTTDNGNALRNALPALHGAPPLPPPMVSSSSPTPLLTTSFPPPSAPPPLSPAREAAAERSVATEPLTTKQAIVAALTAVREAMPPEYLPVLRSVLEPMTDVRRFAWATTLQHLLIGEGGSGLKPTGDQLGRAVQEAAQNGEVQGAPFLGYVRRVIDRDRPREEGALDAALVGASVSERWIARFYGAERGPARQEARRAIARLVAGQDVELKGRSVRPKDLEHFERCAAAMLAPAFALRVPGAALTVLLQKLQDPEKDAAGLLPSEAKAAQEGTARRLEEKYDLSRKKAIARWRDAHPQELAALQESIEAPMRAAGGQPSEYSFRAESLERCNRTIAERIDWPDFDTWLSAERMAP